MGKKLKEVAGILATKGKDIASIFWGSVAIVVFHLITWRIYTEADFGLMEWVGSYVTLHTFVFGGEALKEKFVRKGK